MVGIAIHETSYFSSKASSGLADGIWKLSWKGTKMMRVTKEHTIGHLRCTKAAKLTHNHRKVENTVTHMIYKGIHGMD
jgi:hypothetical protein